MYGSLVMVVISMGLGGVNLNLVRVCFFMIFGVKCVL